jgi:S-adenosylmethionine:tRNA ribosyltransferase-isomerase
MRLADFDYHLPEERIAQEPLADRAGARMLVVHREEGRWEDRVFGDLPEYLLPGDCLVVNDSRVFPARLFGHREGIHALPIGKNNPKRREHLSGAVEVLLLRSVSPDGRDWQALVRPGRKLPVGERVAFDEGLEGEIVGRGEFGERTVRFHGCEDLYAAFERIGHVPLPPYIKRADSPADRDRYQTVFARARGSVAAPTAGLHFTAEVLVRCRQAGAEQAFVTLHVGLGTFQPLHAENVEQVQLHTEHYRITPANAAAIDAARRVVAVGTTSVRTLETVARTGQLEGETAMFLYPGVPFLKTGAMLTNFHLPLTSLLLLVCAFGGRDLVMAAYRHAVESEYRFYSYGDCMLIL